MSRKQITIILVLGFVIILLVVVIIIGALLGWNFRKTPSTSSITAYTQTYNATHNE